MKGKLRLLKRQADLTKSGFPIVVYLTQDSKEKTVATGFYSHKKDWNENTQLPKPSHPLFLDLLNYLEIKKIKLQRLMAESLMRPMVFDEAVARLMGGDSGVFYTEGMAYVNAHPLKRTYRVALTAFNVRFNEYTYGAIDDGVVSRFRESLLNTPVNGRPRSQNGVTSYMSTLAALWNKLGKPNNPFARVKKVTVPTVSKAMTDEDLVKIKNSVLPNDGNAVYGGIYNYMNYWLLCFYLGGVDMIDLVNARYDKNVVGDRFEFVRSKGGTNVFVSNKIFAQARAIMDLYDCYPYVIPLRLYGVDSNSMLSNVSRRYGDIQKMLGLTKKPYSKAPRYTFINRSRELLVDERICIEIVGHSQSSTHSIYKDEFSYSVRDEAHERVIEMQRR